jgi:multidrug efflux pump subunit AcrB
VKGPLGKGPVAWMAGNSVASNLLMGVCVLGGLFMATQVKQEVFPEIVLDVVNVSVPYRGATPAEVETGIVVAVEEAVRGVDGVKHVRGRALEGVASVNVELLDGADRDRALSDVKTAVDRITSFPADAERPTVSLAVNRQRVISLVLYGDLDEQSLRVLGERTRDELQALDEITVAELSGVRPREIAVEVSQDTLRAHGMTLDQIAGAIRRASVEMPGGTLKTASGEVALRTAERKDDGAEFREVMLKSDPRTGGGLRVEDLAQVNDTFEDVDLEATYNGMPAVQVDIYRVGDQTPIQVADAVFDYIEEMEAALPAGVKMSTWNDRSEMFRGRVELLMRNAALGLVLVFLCLGAFLELRLAFWVMLGIPISFLGAFLLMPFIDVSVNMISLFAFIVTLGIVVDDAIVVGENIYEKRQQGLPFLQAATEGAQQVAMPVCFAILTTVAAFSPLFFVPGVAGKFFRVIPSIVICVLLISLVESLFILPAHLAHSKPGKTTGFRGWFGRQHAKIGHALDWWVERVYGPSLKLTSEWRYTTLAVAMTTLLFAFGLLGGGHVQRSFMPKVESDVVRAIVQLPVGAPMTETLRVRDQLVAAANKVVAENGGQSISRGLFAIAGSTLGGGGARGGQKSFGTHLLEVHLTLVPSDERDVAARDVAAAWRKAARGLVGVDRILISSALRTGGGTPIDIQLSHSDVEVLKAASARLALAIGEFEGTEDIDDGFQGGKPQLDVTLKPVGRALGLSETELARQIRGAFFGSEALRQQRGRDEVRVMVRLPAADRRSLASFESLILRTPTGGEIPLGEAATVTVGQAYTEITREDGRRVVNVTADVGEKEANAEEIVIALKAKALPGLTADYPGLTAGFGGQQREQGETFAAMGRGFIMALFVIYALLAVPFRSYLQPLIIMSAIPFGIVGAVAGHVIMGFEVSVISMMGIVALSGVVVNDSLILIVAANEFREEGQAPYDAVVNAAKRRFRPILLTTATTFFGLLPMIFESSVQARFLVPMAISLGFGIVFSTVLILVVVPSLYLILEDFRGLYGIGQGEDVENMTMEPVNETV